MTRPITGDHIMPRQPRIYLALDMPNLGKRLETMLMKIDGIYDVAESI